MIEAESEHGSDGVRLLAADLKGYHHGMGLGDKAAPNRMFIFPYAWGHFGPGTRLHELSVSGLDAVGNIQIDYSPVLDIGIHAAMGSGIAYRADGRPDLGAAGEAGGLFIP